MQAERIQSFNSGLSDAELIYANSHTHSVLSSDQLALKSILRSTLKDPAARLDASKSSLRPDRKDSSRSLRATTGSGENHQLPVISIYFPPATEIIGGILHMEPDHLQKRVTRHDSLTDIPLLRNRQFLGRKETLQEIREYLESQSTVECINPKCVGLFGIRGSGKTQIAIEYAYRRKLDYDYIFWVHAGNEISTIKSFSGIKRRLTSEDRPCHPDIALSSQSNHSSTEAQLEQASKAYKEILESTGMP